MFWPPLMEICSKYQVSHMVIFKRLQSFTQVQHKDNSLYLCHQTLPSLSTFHLTLFKRLSTTSRLILLNYFFIHTIKIKLYLNGLKWIWTI